MPANFFFPSLSFSLFTHCLPCSSALFALSPPTRCLYRIYCALLTSTHPPLPFAPLVLALFAAYLSLPTLPPPSSHLSLSLSKHLTIEAHFFACASFVNFPVISHKIHLQLSTPHPLPLCYVLSPGANHPHSSSFFSDYDLLHTLALPLLPPALPCSSAACSAAAAVAHILSHFSGALHFWCQLPCYF